MYHELEKTIAVIDRKDIEKHLKGRFQIVETEVHIHNRGNSIMTREYVIASNELVNTGIDYVSDNLFGSPIPTFTVTTKKNELALFESNADPTMELEKINSNCRISYYFKIIGGFVIINKNLIDWLLYNDYDCRGDIQYIAIPIEYHLPMAKPIIDKYGHVVGNYGEKFIMTAGQLEHMLDHMEIESNRGIIKYIIHSISETNANKFNYCMDEETVKSIIKEYEKNQNPK